jgi:hypothetical protein
VPDKALVLHLLDDAELLAGGNLRVDAVQLSQGDAVDDEAAQRHPHVPSQVLRTPDDLPAIRPLPGDAALRGDDQMAVVVRGLADEVLTYEWSVGDSRVDEVHPYLDGPAQLGDRRLAVRRVSPDSRARDVCSPEAEPPDREGAGAIGAEGKVALAGTGVVDASLIHTSKLVRMRGRAAMRQTGSQ